MAHYGVSEAKFECKAEPFYSAKIGEWTLIEEFFQLEKAQREAVKYSRKFGPNILVRLERYSDKRRWFYRYGRPFNPMSLASYTAGERAHVPQLPFDR